MTIATILATRCGAVGFYLWFERCWSTGFAHGATLIEDVWNARDGKLTDALDVAQYLLNAAVAADWLRKCKAQGTPSQRANSSCTCHQGKCWYVDHHGFRPVRANFEARAFYREAQKRYLASLPAPKTSTVTYEVFVDGCNHGEPVEQLATAIKNAKDAWDVGRDVSVCGSDSNSDALTRFWIEGRVETWGEWRPI